MRGGKRGWRINGCSVKVWCSDNGQKTDFATHSTSRCRMAQSNNMQVEFEFRKNGNFLVHKERRGGRGEVPCDVHGWNLKLRHLLHVAEGMSSLSIKSF